MGWAGHVFFNIGFEPINHLGDVGAWDQGQSIVDMPQGSLQKLNFTVHTFKLGMARLMGYFCLKPFRNTSFQ